MSLTIVATVGGATSNSLATEAQAITYLAARLNVSGWVTVTGSTATEDEKKALIEATRTLSALGWAGYRTDDVQALSWPRTAVPNPDASLDATPGALTGTPEYEDDEIPDRVLNATIELALEFLRAGTTDIAGVDTTQGVILKTVGPLTTEWALGQRAQGLGRFPRVMQLIAPLLASGTGQMTAVRS